MGGLIKLEVQDNSGNGIGGATVACPPDVNLQEITAFPEIKGFHIGYAPDNGTCTLTISAVNYNDSQITVIITERGVEPTVNLTPS